MVHSFDIDIATKYGVNCAILLQHIYFWVEKNEANENNFFDGKYWTYNTTKAFNKIFPYLSEKQIAYSLKKLEENGLIEIGNYNENKYDHTKWYALTNKGYSILQKVNIEVTKGINLDLTKGRNLINTDINKDINTNKTNEDFSSEDFFKEEEINYNADNNIDSEKFYNRISMKESVYMHGIDIAYAFETIYNKYPIHKSKKDAATAFLRFVKCKDTKGRIIKLAIAVDSYMQWLIREGKQAEYTKHLSTFIHKGIDDEIAQVNYQVQREGHFYETKEEYEQAIISGEIEMYCLPRSCITF